MRGSQVSVASNLRVTQMRVGEPIDLIRVVSSPICFLVLFLGLQSHLTFSQGEDSSSYERDLMVLAPLFVGHYANSSQA